MKDVIKKIFNASKYDKKNIVQKALKLSEECGEVAQAVLSYVKAPACAHKNKTKADVIEETWDVIITAASLLYQVENGKVDEKFSRKILNTKIKKWTDRAKKAQKACDEKSSVADVIKQARIEVLKKMDLPTPYYMEQDIKYTEELIYKALELEKENMGL